MTSISTFKEISQESFPPITYISFWSIIWPQKLHANKGDKNKHFDISRGCGSANIYENWTSLMTSFIQSLKKPQDERWEHCKPRVTQPRRRVAGVPWIHNSDAFGSARRSLNKNKHLLITHFKQTLSYLNEWCATVRPAVWLTFSISFFTESKKKISNLSKECQV